MQSIAASYGHEQPSSVSVHSTKSALTGSIRLRKKLRKCNFILES